MAAGSPAKMTTSSRSCPGRFGATLDPCDRASVSPPGLSWSYVRRHWLLLRANHSRSTRPAPRSLTPSAPSSQSWIQGGPLERLVNELQLAVLEWVAAGCPAGAWETSSYKITCQALQNRGLVRVSRKGGQWSVALTSAGQHYLAHGTYPPRGPRPRKSRTGAPPPSIRAQETPATARKPSPPSRDRVTFTEQLLQELAEAGGRIVKSGGPGSANWPSRIAAARRSGKIPDEGAVRALVP